VTGVRIAAAFALLSCACTQDFNKFLGDGGASDGGSEAATCDVATTCLSAASACGQACISGYDTCTAGCSNQPCRNQCKNTQSSCRSKCTNDCVACADAGACAQTSCQGALP
jgi:hypothetical protein